MLHRIVLLMLLACSITQAEDRILNLAGKWKFHPGDDMRWAAPEVDDSQWADIEVPKAWRDAGYPKLTGYGWDRKVAQLPAEQSAIIFGSISDAYEVFVNGTRIGGAGVLGTPKGQDQYEKGWPIPPAAAPAGGRVNIAVRVWMTPPLGGITSEALLVDRESLNGQLEK